jgi:hypothetical protein
VSDGRIERDRIEDLHRNGIGDLVLPLLLGVSVALVTYLVLFGVVLSIAFARFDYAHAFGNGDAVAIGLQGAIALGSTCVLGAWLTRRRAGLRDVTQALARRAAQLAGVILTVAVLLLGIAPALRLVTAPIYLLAAIGGTALGAALGTGDR